MDQEKLKIAYHETGHVVMALIYGLKISRVSIKGTDQYRGIMSTDPRERLVTNPQEALREVRISLAGFVGEVLISGKYSIVGNHPDLVSAVELIQQMLAYDESFKELVIKLSTTNPGTLPGIQDPLVSAYIEGKLSWCLNKLTPHKTVIKLIAEQLYEKEELTGPEVSILFNPK